MEAVTFKTANVAMAEGFLAVDECDALVREMALSGKERAQLVRAGESILDDSIRHCFDHHLSAATKDRFRARLEAFFDANRAAFASDADYLYGPYFMTYEKGSFFKAHRDVANHRNDPLRLAAHRWSLLLYLNGREPAGPLPTFDGGALVVYETDPKLRDRRVVVVPRPGMLLLFRSSLMHEVATVLDGVRYAVAGWMSSSKVNPLGGAG
jgi:predicted 2-oxoglutarate/Fe(II)-dependent dioxygenase YbiX